MFCLETDSCRAVSRCFTSAEPKTLSCARSLAQEKDRVLRALFFTESKDNCIETHIMSGISSGTDLDVVPLALNYSGVILGVCQVLPFGGVLSFVLFLVPRRGKTRIQLLLLFYWRHEQILKGGPSQLCAECYHPEVTPRKEQRQTEKNASKTKKRNWRKEPTLAAPSRCCKLFSKQSLRLSADFPCFCFLLSSEFR